MTTTRFFRELLRLYPNKCAIIGLMVITTLFGLAGPLLNGALIDALHVGKSWSVVFYFVISTFMVGLFSVGLGYCLSLVQIKSDTSILVSLKNKIWGHLSHISLQEVYKQSPGVWMQRVTGDVDTVCGSFSMFVFSVLNFSLFFAGTAIVIFFKAPIMLLFFVGVAIVGGVIHLFYQRKIVGRARQLRNGMYSFNSVVYDLLMMQPLLRMFGLEELFEQKFSERNKMMSMRHISSQATSLKYNIALGLEMTIVHGMVLSLCVYMYMCGNICLGDIWVYEMLVSQLTGGVNRLLEILPQMDQGIESASSLIAMFKIPANKRIGRKACENDVKLAIEMRDLAFRYCNNTEDVFRGCNLTVCKNEFVCMIGRNGSGKSTLINLILGVLKPTKGSVRLSCVNPAIVPQHISIFRGTVLDNVRLYDERVSPKAVKEALRDCGLEGWLADLKYGLSSKITPESISGGELQRIAIARVLVRDPDLLIVDEVTNNLDIVEKERVHSILAGMKGKRTILAVTHDLDALSICDRAFVFSGGEISEIYETGVESMIDAVKVILRG